MTHLVFFCFVLVVATLLSKVEIEIESGDGYAKNLPVTWRATNKWVRILLAGTSYHLWMGLFLVALVHLPFAVGLIWTLKAELLVLSFLAFLTVFEDFLWFALNPAKDENGRRLYGIRNFRKKHISWFPYWFLGLPIWYWWYAPPAIILYITASLMV